MESVTNTATAKKTVDITSARFNRAMNRRLAWYRIRQRFIDFFRLD